MVVLIAALLTVAAIGFSVIGQADVSGEALRFSAAVRYTFNTAAMSNKTLQMKIDFENRTFSVEELDVVGGISEDELRGTTMSNRDVDLRRNTDRLSRIDAEDTRFGQVRRTQVEDMFISGEDARLASGVYFVGLMTSHHDAIQTDDVGTINFFPNGFVERSVVYLGDERAAAGDPSGVVYTIMLNPLTGHSSVLPGRVEVGSSFFAEEED
ncbi:MAG: hypothetical protein FWC40_07685 [Proteobacteria bacterium]|nr:hypothetical protein [Pseudomonadota bacterium]